MSDKEKVIKGLDEVWEYMSKNIKDIASRKARMMDKVVNACNLLKEQEPVSPVKKHGTYWCAKCDKHLKTIGLNVRDNYCSQCGTEVLWNGDENE